MRKTSDQGQSAIIAGARGGDCKSYMRAGGHVADGIWLMARGGSCPPTPDSRLPTPPIPTPGEQNSPGVGFHRFDGARRMTALQGQGLLRSLAASGSCLTAGATGEAAVGSFDAAHLLRSATSGSRFTAGAAGEAAVGSLDAARLLRSAAGRSRRAAAGIRGGLRTHSIADQSQDRGTDQRHHVSTIHDKLPNLSRYTTQ